MPDILTGGPLVELLTDEALGRADIQPRIDRAEMRVIGRYREKEARPDRDFGFRNGLVTRDEPGIVELWGWAETDDGTPAPDEMPDDLVHRLRMVISEVVLWEIERDETEGLESESVGSKNVSYADTKDLPSRLFQPLDKYDTREPVSGFW